MASGKKHDKATKVCSLIFGFVTGLLVDVKTGIWAGTSFAIGGLWLSPDLDTKSKPLKRWGILKILWAPYRKLIPHRSFLSHSPFIGTTLRVAYLIIIIILLIFLAKILGIEYPKDLTRFITENFDIYKKEMIVIFIGLEMSAWLHLFQDL